MGILPHDNVPKEFQELSGHPIKSNPYIYIYIYIYHVKSEDIVMKETAMLGAIC